jgi:hypothetical protein
LRCPRLQPILAYTIIRPHTWQDITCVDFLFQKTVNFLWLVRFVWCLCIVSSESLSFCRYCSLDDIFCFITLAIPLSLQHKLSYHYKTMNTLQLKWWKLSSYYIQGCLNSIIGPGESSALVPIPMIPTQPLTEIKI